MTFANPSTPHAAASSSQPRADLYAGVHKALRQCMAHTLCRVGSVDPTDDADVANAVQAVQELLVLCQGHLEKENQFVHPLLQQAQGGAADRAEQDHVHHEAAIEALGRLVRDVAELAQAQRADRLATLYRELAAFVAENLEHMAYEESVHNAVLWSGFSDEELHATEQALVASIAPPLMMRYLHWFLPALSPAERAQMLGGMRAAAPAAAFEAVVQLARQRLSGRDYDKLATSLELSAEPA